MHDVEAVPALEALGLSKTFGRSTTVLSDITLSIPGGSIVGLIGPNGAGKTTLIRTWVGYERPSRGSVRVAGVDPWLDRTAALRSIAYVPQTGAVYGNLTAREHLILATNLRDGFDRDVAFSTLAHFAISPDVPLRKLSGGQRALVSLVLALATRAAVILLDEPLAHLDPLVRYEFLGLVATLGRSQTNCVVLSSHLVAELAAIADRLLAIGGGRILLDEALPIRSSKYYVASGESAPTGTVVGRLPNSSTRESVIVANGRRSAEHNREATLEEVVMASLMSARAE